MVVAVAVAENYVSKVDEKGACLINQEFVMPLVKDIFV